MKLQDIYNSILHKQEDIDKIYFSFNEDDIKIPFSPITKISLYFANEAKSKEKNNLVFLMPGAHSELLLTLVANHFNEIIKGNSTFKYDPTKFEPGQKCKFGNNIVKFVKFVPGDQYPDKISRVGFTFGNDNDSRNSPCTSYYPVDKVPFFQPTKSNRQLTPILKVQKEFKKFQDFSNKKPTTLDDLVKYKTIHNHISIIVTPLQKAKDFLSNLKINDYHFSKLVLYGNITSEGEIKIINSGQYDSEPSIILAKDLYYVMKYFKKSRDFNIDNLYIYLDDNIINSQLDILDDISSLYKIPIICFGNSREIINVHHLRQRGYFIYNWNKVSIVPPVDNSQAYNKINKLKNCKNQKISYHVSYDSNLYKVMKLFFKNKSYLENASITLHDASDIILSKIFIILRNVMDLPTMEYQKHYHELIYIEQMLYTDFQYNFNYANMVVEISKLLKEYFEENSSYEKIFLLLHYLRMHNDESVCIVADDYSDINLLKAYWNDIIKLDGLQIDIDITTISKFLNNEKNYDSICIIAWFKKRYMEDILFKYNTSDICILFYEYELKWKAQFDNYLNKIINFNDNENFLSFIGVEIQHIEFNDKYLIDENETINEIVEGDDVETLERVIFYNKIKKYSQLSGKKEENVEVIPLSFNGDYVLLATLNHKLILVTDIIYSDEYDSEVSVKEITPKDIHIGDFIVKRESDKDIIADIANKILYKNGYEECRYLSGTWKRALKSILHNYSERQLIRMLIKSGCNRNRQTIREWINNDDYIMPNNIDDIKIIAKVTNYDDLKYNIENVYNAGRIVKNAHVDAGRHLSKKLKTKITEKLQTMVNLDPQNIWEPLEIDLEDIGQVKILKVVDKGTAILVDPSNVNKLLND